MTLTLNEEAELTALYAQWTEKAAPVLLETAPDGEWFKHYFPERCYRDFTFYQKDFWNWVNEIVIDERPRPRVECEPRAVGKSTNARGATVKLLAEEKKFYVLYVSATDNQAQKHFNAIRSMLESGGLLNDYPHLSPQVQKHRPNVNSNWSSERLVTKANQVVEFISLLGNARGFTTEEGKRPDLIVLDDIDDSKDTPHMIQKKLDILRYSILPARAENTLVLFPQNLIHRDSICQQIKDGRADILNDRIFVGPYPLMKWYEAEKETLEDGAMRWRIIAGEPADSAIPVSYCEEVMNEIGREAFDRECQQDVFKVSDENDFREWSEIHHIITYSEFREYFEARGQVVWDERRDHPVIPDRWNVGMGLDWGTTLGHPSAVAMVARPNASAPLADSYFVFSEVILPKYPHTQGEAVPPVSPGRLVEAIQGSMYEWGVSDAQVKRKLMSHEASAALNTMAIDLQDDLKMFFNKWQAKKGSGVPQLQNTMELDRSKPHPFRKVEGCPRLFFVVPDDQGELLTGEMGRTYVRQPYDRKGFARARYEIPLYNHRNTGQNKIDDDFVDAIRGLANVFMVTQEGYSKSEKVEMKLEEIGLGAEQVQDNPGLITRRMDMAEKMKAKKPSYRRVGVPTRRGR